MLTLEQQYGPVGTVWFSYYWRETFTVVSYQGHTVTVQWHGKIDMYPRISVHSTNREPNSHRLISSPSPQFSRHADCTPNWQRVYKTQQGARAMMLREQSYARRCGAWLVYGLNSDGTWGVTWHNCPGPWGKPVST